MGLKFGLIDPDHEVAAKQNKFRVTLDGRFLLTCGEAKSYAVNLFQHQLLRIS